MRRARVIVRYGIGVDNVDLKAASERGIPVCNVPDYCVDEVADHTLAFILGVTRQVVPNTLIVREGKWGLATPLDQLRTLRDQTVGLVGFGRIGREVASCLAPFKCRRFVHDKFVPADAVRAAGCEPVAFDVLLVQSDIVTLHVDGRPGNAGLFGAREFGLMRPRSLFLNLCRGIVVLGQSAPEDELLRAFETSAGFSCVKGFAIGRTIFHDVAAQWLTGTIDDDSAVREMAKKLSRLVSGWQEMRRAAPDGVSRPSSIKETAA